MKNGDEWSSPAFIKRARTSYGSLFDTGYDPFAEEDGTIPGKRRKRARLSSTWRYVSRSPSPEPDEEPLDISSPATASSARAVDEDRQTATRENEHDARALADLSKQVANNVYSIPENAEISVFGQGHLEYNHRLPGSRNDEMPPPAILTHFGQETQQAHEQERTPLQAPHSPHLKPISSDSLPLPSPLIVSKPALAPGDDVPSQSIQPFGARPALSDQAPPSQAEEDDGNTFQTNSVDHESHVEEFRAFPDSAMGTNEIGPSSFETEFPFKSQFPHQYDEVHLDTSKFPISGAAHYPPYPALDHGLHDQPVETSWTHISSAVSYPDLPETQKLVNNIPPLSTHPVENIESSVVDLTESEDEEERGPPQIQVEEEASEGSVGSSVKGNNVERKETFQSNLFSGDQAHLEDGEEEEVSQDEEEIYEEYSEEDDDSLPPRYERTEAFSDEDDEENIDEEIDEEESYDEDDMEDDEPQGKPLVQREPVFIDLLSSDDEDDENLAIPAPQPLKSPQKRPRVLAADDAEQEEQMEEEDEESELDEEIARKDELDSVKRVPLPTGSPEKDSEESSAEIEKEDRDVEMEAAVKDGFEDVADGKSGDNTEADDNDDIDVVPRELKELSAPPQTTDDELPRDNHEALNVQVDDGGSNNENGRSTVIPANEISTAPAQSSEKPEVSQEKEYYVGKPTAREEPSLFARIFNLDGANDAPTQVLYPTLPTEENIELAGPVSGTPPDSQGMAIDQLRPLVQGHVQLPTPDHTQISQVKDSQETPSIVSGGSQTEDGLQVSSMIDPASESGVEPFSDKVKVMELDGKAKEAVEDEFVEAEPTNKEMSKEDAKEAPAEQLGEVDIIHYRSPAKRSEVSNDDSATSLDNHDQDPEKSTLVGPRRSRRIGKPSGSAAEIAAIMRPSTPDNSCTQPEDDNVQKGLASPVILDSRAKQDEHDPSIEMALESSPRLGHDLRSRDIVDLKLSLSRALRTDLKEFTPLKVLRYHLNQKLDIMAIVTTTPSEPQRTRGGPRHYQIAFNVTDFSIAPSGITEVQVFRPYIEALPVVRAGDGILLRNFQVTAVKNRGFALRSEQNEASSWAVFKDGVSEPEVRGPPVEYGAAEQKHMVSMKEWYSTLDAAAVAKLERANADKGSGVGKKA